MLSFRTEDTAWFKKNISCFDSSDHRTDSHLSQWQCFINFLYKVASLHGRILTYICRYRNKHWFSEVFLSLCSDVYYRIMSVSNAMLPKYWQYLQYNIKKDFFNAIHLINCENVSYNLFETCYHQIENRQICFKK